MSIRIGYTVLASLLSATILLSACQPVQPPPPPPPPPSSATAKAAAQLTNEPGRAIVSARGNHFVIDSPGALAGPNEEVNPLDALLAALGSCGIFVAEAAAPKIEAPLTGASAVVQGDFDPRGLKGEAVDPSLQALRVHLALPGAEADQAAKLVENFQARCPIYTTLVRAVPIEITVGDQAMGSPTEGLTTGEVMVHLSNQPGRALVSARGNHFVVDSIPPLGGPNEERNPMDLLLGALATCGSFVYETAAQELGIPLTGVSAAVEADFDPRGIKTGEFDPHIQALRVNMTAEGANAEQAEQLAQAFQARCPVFTTLVRAAPITLNGVEVTGN
jgi:putative redox protein